MKALLKKTILTLLWQAVQRKYKAEHPVVIAVTGSVGKTSTKDAIALALQKKGSVIVKTYGSLNTETGVALSLLGCTEGPKSFSAWFKVGLLCLAPPIQKGEIVYVLEYSADRPGDIRFLAGKLPLDVAVLTSIVPVHMERYAHFEELVSEKLSILEGLKPGGMIIANADDPVQVRELRTRTNQILWYGLVEHTTKKPGCWAHSVRLGEIGLSATIEVMLPQKMDGITLHKPQSLSLTTQLIGRHQLYGVIAAVAVGVAQKISLVEIVQNLTNLQAPAGRGRIIEGRQDIRIIDDTYNASPEAVKAGLQMLRGLAGERRVVAILGNMNELGEMSAQAHADVAIYAVGKVDFLVAVGPEGRQMVTAAKKAGQPAHGVMSFASPENLLDKLDQIVKRNDLVYVRGSQNKVFLERVVKALMAHPEQASTLLVRQSKYWYDKYAHSS